MKALILSTVILTNCISARADDAVGRFQFVPAIIHSTSMVAGGSGDERKLFKIDTVTGRTWEYISTDTVKGLPIEKWIETGE